VKSQGRVQVDNVSSELRPGARGELVLGGAAQPGKWFGLGADFSALLARLCRRSVNERPACAGVQ